MRGFLYVASSSRTLLLNYRERTRNINRPCYFESIDPTESIVCGYRYMTGILLQKYTAYLSTKVQLLAISVIIPPLGSYAIALDRLYSRF